MDDQFDWESGKLALEKIETRTRLLTTPPLEAQKLVEQTLYPQYWELRSKDDVWAESMPTHYRPQ